MPDAKPAPTAPYHALHIGRSKCASTYLQRVGLAQHPQLEVVFEQHKAAFLRHCDYGLHSGPESLAHDLASLPLPPLDSGRRRVLSLETLSGQMHTGAGASQCAQLLVDTFGPLKTFVVIRNPYDYIYSVWNQYVQEGGVLGLRDYLYSEASPSWHRHWNQSLLWRTARNMPLITRWRALVSARNFKVLLLEDLISRPDRFWAELYSFLEVDAEYTPPPDAERPGFTPVSLGLARYANRLYHTPHHPAGLLPYRWHMRSRQTLRRLSRLLPKGRKPNLRAMIPMAHEQAIREDNALLAGLLDRDLSEVGYATP